MSKNSSVSQGAMFTLAVIGAILGAPLGAMLTACVAALIGSFNGFVGGFPDVFNGGGGLWGFFWRCVGNMSEGASGLACDWIEGGARIGPIVGAILGIVLVFFIPEEENNK
jgi:hypothetical protein